MSSTPSSTGIPSLAVVCRIVALVLFVIGGTTRWWPQNPQTYWGSPLISWGLAFLTLSFIF